MKILSIDTSSSICGTAILEDEKLIKEINLDNGLTHSETLMPTIKQIFLDTNLSLQDIDLIVCDKGPGSFTGIRIGTSTAMAFSDSLNIPTCGISSLEALAYNINKEGIICSLIDAKNDNCYCGVYKLINGNYTLQKPLIAEHIDIILDNLKEYKNQSITFVGNGAFVHEYKIKSFFTNYIISEKFNLSAFKLGLAGLHSYSSGIYENIMPLYLRKSQAERMQEKLQPKEQKDHF